MTEPTNSPDFRTSLAHLGEDDLAKLLRIRPDVAYPLPPGVNALASRLTLPGSLSRAVRRLNTLEIAALESAGDLGAELEPVAVQAIVDTLPVRAELAHGAIEKLRALALLFGTDPVQVTPGALGALPSGWRVRDALPASAEETERLVEKLDRPARAVLETLATSGSVGTTRDAAPDADPTRPIPRLIAAGLLERVNASTVRLPRPVRDILRGEAPRVLSLTPSPRIQGTIDAATPEAISRIDDAATVQGLEATRTLRKLVTYLGREPSPLNRDGSVGVRALTGLAKAVDADEKLVALLVTVGESAGILGRGEIEVDVDGLAPTPQALEWADATLSDQWAIVLAGWMASPWRVNLLGTKDTKGQAIRLLGDAMHDPEVRSARTIVVQQFSRVPGTRLSRDEVSEDMWFSAPIQSSGISASDRDAFIAEAHIVGGLSDHASSSALAVVSDGNQLAETTRSLVPAEVSYVIPQADMTILAPGPLPPEMHSELELFADLESPGLASVFRIRAASVRKALDVGRQPEEIVRWLENHSPAGVPQPMAFLITDAGRNHGSIRAGEALSYVRSADESVISHALGLLGEDLFAIAPQAAVSHLPLNSLMQRLRSAGLQPIAEDASGASIAFAPEPTLVAATPSTLVRDRVPDDAHIAKAIAAITSQEAESSRPIEGAADSDHVTTLQAAARASKQVAIGYVNKDGQGSQITVVPLSVNAGQVDALNEKTGSIVRISLPRITKVIVDS